MIADANLVDILGENTSFFQLHELECDADNFKSKSFVPFHRLDWKNFVEISAQLFNLW